MHNPAILREVSKSQILSAYRLAREAFNWNPSQQRAPLDFKENRDLVIAILGDEVVGMLRLLPRPFRNGSRVVNSGLVDAVVVKQQHRGIGVGRIMVEEGQRRGRANGYESLHLFARRAADGLYTKFGFWGASSYPDISILGALKTRHKYTWAEQRKATTSDIEFLSEGYDIAYKDSAGCYLRDESCWVAIMDTKLPSVEILLLVRGHTRVGYVAVEESQVVEVGLHPDIPDVNLEFLYDLGYSVLRIPPEHQLLHESTQPSSLDVRVSYRSCHYGGHMICLLEESNIVEQEISSFEQMSKSLGAQRRIVGLQSGERALNFNRLDELIT